MEGIWSDMSCPLSCLVPLLSLFQLLQAIPGQLRSLTPFPLYYRKTLCPSKSLSPHLEKQCSCDQELRPWDGLPGLDTSLLSPSHGGLVKSLTSLTLGFLFDDRKEMEVPCSLFSFCLVPVGVRGALCICLGRRKQSKGVSYL